METRFLQRASARALKPLHAARHLRCQYTTSRPSSQQANPIGDYYASLLESSTPSITSQPPTTAHPISTPAVASSTNDPDEQQSQDDDDGPAILFSSRLSSPLERRSEIRRKSTMVAGVWVPPRPDEPDNCCMSGCVNCVWDRYRDEMEEWAGARREADQAARREKSFQRQKGRKRSLGGEKGAEHVAVSMDDDDGGSESNWRTGLDSGFMSEELFKDVPVGIREFMKQEKRLKEKHARERSSGG